MAAFYADAAPVATRLEWSAGPLLQFIGMHADMMSAGCSFEGVTPVLDCVRNNLTKMNELRQSVLMGK